MYKTTSTTIRLLDMIMMYTFIHFYDSSRIYTDETFYTNTIAMLCIANIIVLPWIRSYEICSINAI